MRQIRAAVVGLGWWGRNLAGLLRGNAKLAVACGVDVDPAAAQVAAALRIPFQGDFNAVLADPGIDAVVLCTPHSQHCGQIVRAAGAKKHVFCEKPLSLSRADVLEAVAACNANGVALAAGHEKRFEPPVLELFRMAAAGELGTLLQVEGNFSQDKFLSMPAHNWRLTEKDAPAGPMTATGIHLLDLSIGLLGPAESVLARVRQLASGLVNGDSLALQVSFKNGTGALISAILATPFDGRFAVYGSKGWAEVRDKAHPEAPEGWVLSFKLKNKQRETKEYPPANAVLANLEAFADAAAGRAPYPVPQEQMIANISALEAVFRSARNGNMESVDNGERQ
jgi:predicted dehydrogenase